MTGVGCPAGCQNPSHVGLSPAGVEDAHSKERARADLIRAAGLFVVVLLAATVAAVLVLRVLR